MKRQGISKRLRFAILMRDHFMCRYCAARGPGVDLVIDHVKAVARGGTNHRDNLVTACFACNAGKSDVELTVLPPWEPLPEKPGFTPIDRGWAYRVGRTHWEALEAEDETVRSAINEVWRRANASAATEDEDGQELEPCLNFDLTIWRPASSPHADNEFEPHCVFIFSEEEGYREVWADKLEAAARELFDALPHHEGWTYWRGGSCPLPDTVNEYGGCEYLFRSGDRDTDPRWLDCPWRHLGPEGWDGRGDIIAYRVIRVEKREPLRDGLMSYDEMMGAA